MYFKSYTFILTTLKSMYFKNEKKEHHKNDFLIILQQNTIKQQVKRDLLLKHILYRKEFCVFLQRMQAHFCTNRIEISIGSIKRNDEFGFCWCQARVFVNKVLYVVFCDFRSSEICSKITEMLFHLLF